MLTTKHRPGIETLNPNCKANNLWLRSWAWSMRVIMPVTIGIALVLLSGCGASVQVQLSGGATTVGSSSGGSSNTGNNPSPANSSSYQFGVQLKTAGCRVNDKFPDSACTPGAIFSDATVNQICQSGYSSSVRNVPTSEKDQVYAEYGIVSRTTGEYEVDHLVSLELGGSNDISNLWPEAAAPKPGFHEKDSVENYLHDEVCSGKIGLRDAQVLIATNWLSVWTQMGN